MCNCSSNFSNYDGFGDNEFDSFIRSKAGKKEGLEKKHFVQKVFQEKKLGNKH
jgi:hypothetical protein